MPTETSESEGLRRDSEVKDAPTELTEEEIYRIAESVLKRRFYTHFALYIVPNLLLVAIWRATGSSFPWFLFPLGIWGIFILLHFVQVFVLPGRIRRLSHRIISNKERIEEQRQTEAEKLKEVAD